MRGANSPLTSAHGQEMARAHVRLWLDDDLIDRSAPSGWVHVTTAPEAIKWLRAGNVIELSLDHDLGSDEEYGRGIDVVDFLCERAFNGDPLWPYRIYIHTANPYGRDAMVKALLRHNPAYLRSTAGGQPVLTLRG